MRRLGVDVRGDAFTAATLVVVLEASLARGSAGPVYGTDIYSDDSSICTAAVHAGRVDFAEGGLVTIQITGPRAGQITLTCAPVCVRIATAVVPQSTRSGAFEVSPRAASPFAESTTKLPVHAPHSPDVTLLRSDPR